MSFFFGAVAAARSNTFPIPMRGNEESLQPHMTNGLVVSDPHEG